MHETEKMVSVGQLPQEECGGKTGTHNITLRIWLYICKVSNWSAVISIERAFNCRPHGGVGETIAITCTH